jgi:Domain of unknown function (DUF4032)/Lipopolysaccharide kinase (Kdo/WaaP) family
MVPAATVTVRAGHPDFLDLPWDSPLAGWDDPRLIDLPKGISRHEVRFIAMAPSIYAIKELPTKPARRDYDVLRRLELADAPAVRAVGLVEGRHPDPTAEQAAALITRYEDFSYSYLELLQGPGFGIRRNQMLDAFAGLFAELHVAGCFWGDGSLSNVLYRFDADKVETMLVDAETAEVHPELSDGQREQDLGIMIENVAWGMADIAAQQGVDVEEADMALGEGIADRYRGLWRELTEVWTIGPDERYKINERIESLNELGFIVEEVDLVPSEDGDRFQVRARVGGRAFHGDKLRELTGVDALEFQARQILSDLHYFQSEATSGETLTGKAIDAVRWRVNQFEPMLIRLRSTAGVVDPVQAYCDVLYHRYAISKDRGFDVGTDLAFDDWVAKGRPGYPLV